MPSAAAARITTMSDYSQQQHHEQQQWQCRWAIVGCDADAAAFLQAMLKTRTPKIPPRINGVSKNGAVGRVSSEASASTSRIVEHDVVAVASDASGINARTFLGQHASGLATAQSDAIRAFVSSSALLQDCSAKEIDYVFVAGTPSSRHGVALAALRRGMGVLVCSPPEMLPGKAEELCNEAKYHDGAALGFLMMAKRQAVGRQHDAMRAAADACAHAKSEGNSESERLPWSQAIAALETLEELRTSLREQDTGDASSLADTSGSSPAESLAVSDNRRPASRSSTGSERISNSPLPTVDDVGTPRSTAALRSQLQELKHILRHKTAVISTLEQKAGMSPGTAERQAGRSRNRTSLPPSSRNTLSQDANPLAPRMSVDGALNEEDEDESYATTEFPSVDADKSPSTPFSNISNNAEGTPVNGRRRRKDAGNASSLAVDAQSPAPKSATSHLGLENISERCSSPGFETSVNGGAMDAGVRAKRRVSTRNSPKVPAALMSNGRSSPMSASNASTKLSTSSASDNKNSAGDGTEVVRDQLRISQRTVKTLQRALDEERQNSSRANAEVTELKDRLAAKERYIDEVLGRARKAETESRELGKSSRDWGARVRKIEAELGEERMHKQRIEMQYEALATTWKQTREAWEKEMRELRENQGEAVRRNRKDAQNILAKFHAAQEAWQARDSAGSELRSVLGALEREREQATKHIQAPVAKLSAALAEHEAHTSQQDAALADVKGELQRIKRLMRQPVS